MSGSLSMSGSRANGSRTFLTGTNGLDVPGSGGSTEVVRSVNDLLERNAELVTALQRERNRAADSLRKIDSLERELEAERTQRQKLEIDSADGVKELLAARQEVMERRTEVAATEHQAGEQQRLQGQRRLACAPDERGGVTRALYVEFEPQLKKRQKAKQSKEKWKREKKKMKRQVGGR